MKSFLYAVAALLFASCCTPMASAAATHTVVESPCSTAAGRGTAATSYRQLRAWTDRFVSPSGPEPMTPTSVLDSVRQAFGASPYYLSREGDSGKGYAQILYDPHHRVLALCLHDDAWTAFSLVANVPPPPFDVVHADLAGVATRRGIHLGSSIAQVEAVYGGSRLVRVNGGPPELSYLRQIPMPSVSGVRVSPEGAETWFAIVNGHVASISLGAGF